MSLQVLPSRIGIFRHGVVFMPVTLPVLNLAAAKYECIFGRGCDGICCQNGRPSVGIAERKRIGSVLDRVLPHLHPAARELIESEGFTSKRTKLGQPMVRVAGGWCVFFNKGCVLHKIGAEDGDSYQYKPRQCALFPLDKNDDGELYVRQWGYEDEEWDLFCLNPDASNIPAAESLQKELELAQVAG
jgi:Fe-S-cluster containining protein